MTTLVVGRGLLGTSIARALERAGDDVRGVAVPWGDQDAAFGALLAAAAASADASEAAGTPWRLVWSAGAGVVATPAAEFEAEVALFERFVSSLDRPPGAMFLASSAGGVYAGSAGPPFTESHEPRPTAAYGRAKLAVEVAARGLAERGTRVAIGRCGNIYGPGQDLTKPQGLVSQLCLSRLTGRPLHIYVSIDTLRDYVYVDDAAAVAVAMLGRVGQEPPGTVRVKIIATGHTTSVAGLISAATRALRRRPLVVHGVVRESGQVTDLRLRSRVWPDLDGLVRTPLVVGLRATAEGLSAEHRAARLATTDGRPG